MHKPAFELRIARNDADIHAAQRLRYEVFVEELGADGEHVNHAERLETDALDPYFTHLLLLDHAKADKLEDQTVGVYRLMDEKGAKAAGRFYSANEYDLSPLLSSGRKLLEFGRSCLHRDYRGGVAMAQLWRGIIEYVDDGQYELLFGTASFHGTEPALFSQALSLLYHAHLAPEKIRARAHPFSDMAFIRPEEINRIKAMRDMPPLIKGYLKLGSYVGDGAFIDHSFNTTDILLILDRAKTNEKQLELYRKLGASAH